MTATDLNYDVLLPDRPAVGIVCNSVGDYLSIQKLSGRLGAIRSSGSATFAGRLGVNDLNAREIRSLPSGSELQYSYTVVPSDFGALGLGDAKLIQRLLTIAENCSQRGWDGDNEEAISWATVRMVARMALSLRPAPGPTDLIPEADGWIAVEWRKNIDNNLIISISGRGEYCYVGRLDGNQISGSGLVGDDGSEKIRSLIKSVTLDSHGCSRR